MSICSWYLYHEHMLRGPSQEAGKPNWCWRVTKPKPVRCTNTGFPPNPICQCAINASELARRQSSNFRISGNPDFRKSGCPEIRISGYPDIQISEYPEIRKSGFPDITISGLSGYPDIRISGYPGFPDVLIPGFPEIRIKARFMICLCKAPPHIFFSAMTFAGMIRIRIPTPYGPSITSPIG